MAYLALDYPGGAELPLILVAIYSATAAGHRWWAAVVVGLVGGVGLVYRAFVEQEPPLLITITTALLVLVALLGDGVHTCGRLRAEIRERLRVARAEKELETRARVTGERLRIAHELHDVMAHTITTMTVQAGVAADLLDERPEEARSALRTLRASARDATAELRATITVLHAGEDAPRACPLRAWGCWRTSCVASRTPACGSS